MKLPELKIGDLIAKIPIIQGGMSIRVSTSALAIPANSISALIALKRVRCISRSLIEMLARL